MARPRGKLPRILLGVAGGLVVALVGLLAVLHIAPVATPLADRVFHRVTLLPGATAGVESFRLRGLEGVEIHGFRLARGDTLLVAVEEIRAGIRWIDLVGGRVHLTSLEADGVRTAIYPRTAAPAASTGHGFSPRDLLEGRFYSGPPLRVDAVRVRSAEMEPGDLVPGASPGALAVALSARDVKLGNGLAFRVDSLAVSYSLGVRRGGTLELRLRASLTGGRLDVSHLSFRGPASRVDGRAHLDAGAAAGTGTDQEIAFDLAPLALSDFDPVLPAADWSGTIRGKVGLRGPRPDRLSGSVEADLDEGRIGGVDLGHLRLRADAVEGNAGIRSSLVVGGAHAELDGRVRAEDRAARYEATVTLDRLPRGFPGAGGWNAFAARADAAVTLHLVGDGWKPSRITVDGETAGATGRIAFRGSLTVSGLEWELDRADLETVDVAAWGGDTAGSEVSGTVRARGRGSDSRTLEGAAVWNLGASSYRGRRIRSGSGTVTMRGTRVGASLTLDTDGGEVSIDTLRVGLEDGGSLEAPAIHVAGLDPAYLTGDPRWAGGLDGVLALQGSGFLAADPGGGRPLAAHGDLRLEPSVVGGRRIERATATIRLRDGRLDVDVRAGTVGGDLEAAVWMRPFDEPPTAVIDSAAFRDVDLAVWTGKPIATRITGTLRGRGSLGARGEGGRAEPSGSVTLALAPARVGSLSIPAAALEADLAGGVMSADGRLGADSSAARFRVDGRATGGELDATLTASLPIRFLADAAGRDTLAAGGSLELTAGYGRGGPRGTRGFADLGGRGRLGDVALDSILVRLDASETSVRVESLLVASDALTVHGSGVLGLSGSGLGSPTELRLDVETTHPGRLRGWVGADTLDLGRGGLALRLSGPPDARTVSAEGSLESLVVNDLRLRSARLEAVGALDRSWRPRSASIRVDAERFRRPPFRADRIAADLAYRPDSLDVTLTADLDRETELLAAGTAARDTAGMSIVLRRAELGSGESAWRLRGPAKIRREGERLAIDPVEIGADSGSVRVEGVLDRRGDQDFRAVAENVGLETVSRWFGLDAMRGRLDGSLEITGPSTAPRLVGGIRARPVEGGRALGVLDTGIEWTGSQARLRASFVTPAGDSVNAVVRVPVTLSLARGGSPPTGNEGRTGGGEIEAELVAERFPLSALQPLLPSGILSVLDGALDADLRLSGREGSIAGGGRLVLAGGAVGPARLGVVYRDVHAEASLDGNRLVLGTLTARSGKGSVRMTGEVTIAGLDDVRPRLALTARDFLCVDTPETKAVMSADLSVDGSLAVPRIRGSVSAAGCVYTLTDETVAGLQGGPEVRLTPDDVRMMESTFGYQDAPVPSPVTGFYEASDLDLQVTLGANNWVRKRRSPKVNVPVTGSVQARKPSKGELRLYGKLAPVPGRGSLEYLGRTFEFAGGEIRFEGPPEDADLDLKTEYKVRTPGSPEPEVVVHLDLQGGKKDLKLSLTSDPPLSETEIATYVTTGYLPAGSSVQPQEGGGAMAMAAGIGLSEVAGPLEGVVQEKVGLDVLQVRYDAQQGATVVAGRYLGPSLYVGLRQPVQYQKRDNPSQQDPYQTLVELEFEAYHWLILNLQGERTWLRSSVIARHEY